MIPAPSELRHCTDCGQAILWTLTEHHRRMAVDSRPDPTGNQACYRAGGRNNTWYSRSLDGTDAPPPHPWEHRYKPHVANCRPPAVQPEIPGLEPAGATVIRLDTHRRRVKRRTR